MLDNQGKQDQKIVILGAGIVGCSIAFALAKIGMATINVDTLPAAGYGSTSHSSAVIRPVYSHITSCAIAHESRFLWQQWPAFLDVDDERGFAKYTECGGLLLVKAGQEDLYQANLDAMSAVGVDFEVIDADAIKRLYPGISLDSYGPPRTMHDDNFGLATEGKIGPAILVPAAGYVSDPQLASHNLQMAAEALGAEFRFNQKTVSILRDQNAVQGIKLANGERIMADIVVNATGPHSSVVNAMAGISCELKIKTEAQRHEVVYLPATARHFSKTQKFIVDLDSGVYMRPDGQDMLIGSADPECDGVDHADPDDYNTSFTEQWTKQSYRAAQRFPEMGISNTARGTVGLYDVSDDWIPIYDKCNLRGFYLAIGTSGNQFKNAPLIGEMMAEIIQRQIQGVDHDAQPASLYLENIKRSVSLDFYSRNRELQKTNSVLA